MSSPSRVSAPAGRSRPTTRPPGGHETAAPRFRSGWMSRVRRFGYGGARGAAHRRAGDDRTLHRRCGQSVGADSDHRGRGSSRPSRRERTRRTANAAPTWHGARGHPGPLRSTRAEAFSERARHPRHAVVGQPVRFTTYSNYPRYIERSEVRLFGPDQSVQQAPLAVIPVQVGGSAQWVPPGIQDPPLKFTQALATPPYVTYVLRCRPCGPFR